VPRTADPATRDRIVATAGRLFYERGVRGVGMAEIVSGAGCGKNALYRWFPSKAELSAAYLLGFAELRAAATRHAVEGLDEQPAEALVALTRELAKRSASAEFRGCPFRNYLREFTSYDDEPGRVAVHWVNAARAQVAGLVEQLDVADPDELTERVWLVMEGLYSPVPAPDPDQTADVAVRLVEELVAGC
jgi:AcrR family transcriptional regulator